MSSLLRQLLTRIVVTLNCTVNCNVTSVICVVAQTGAFEVYEGFNTYFLYFDMRSMYILGRGTGIILTMYSRG